MKRELLIEYTPDLVRAALLEDGKLCELHRERVRRKKLTDSLFCGVVKAIRPSVGAAFVDIGEELNAFLPIQEGQSLKCGDYVIVQGTAVQAVDTKGLRVSSKINLAGKWLVLVPGSSGVHVSKKIKDPGLRDSLISVVSPLRPQTCGLIVRTASADITEDALKKEAAELEGLWLSIQCKAKGMVKPGLLYEPADLIERLIRDIGNTLTRVLVNDRAILNRINALSVQGWMNDSSQIEFFDEEKHLMNDVFSLDAQVDRALRKRVWLDCGGYLVFDSCEALTVVDVNSAKMTLGRDAEDTAIKVNLEAAVEIARQLRLRNIGGIIIADYIDMVTAEHRELLLKTIKEEAQRDRSSVTVHGITNLGLVEMVRTRKEEQLSKALQSACKVCGGDGSLLSAEESAFRVVRQLRRMILAKQRGPFLIRCSSHVASALQEMEVPDTDQPVYAVSEQGKNHERFEINQLDTHAVLPKGVIQLNKG